MKYYPYNPDLFVPFREWTPNRSIPKNRHKSMNFERYAAEGNRFIKEVAEELGTNRDQAARITRAILHAIRDRLPVNEAVEFAQGLPMILKGVFFDRYDASKAPIRIRDKRVFIEFIRMKVGLTAAVDVPGIQSVIHALQAFFHVLDRNMSYGQIRQVKRLLNRELVELIEN